MSIPKRMGYADTVVDTKYLNTTALHKVWFDKKETYEEATKVHSLLGWISGGPRKERRSDASRGLNSTSFTPGMEAARMRRWIRWRTR